MLKINKSLYIYIYIYIYEYMNKVNTTYNQLISYEVYPLTEESN
jgi:hypothetical protein